jgi:3-deoxy-7-phosphoheptulonate synthase
MKHKYNVVKVGPSLVGGGPFTVWAGPCSVENEEQFRTTAREIKKHGGAGLRGGLYKLRTDPAAFQGLGREAFDMVREIKRDVGMPFISEITDARQISDLVDVVDVFQVGSRNMYNYALLKELAQVDKPVMLKRGLSATFKEWILAADYLVKGGNEKVILCERGIRTFETATRNTFDINIIALAKQETPFPVIADPSHGTGRADLVPAVALAAAAAGADGLIVEVHPNPREAKSDGPQSLDFTAYERLMEKLPRLLAALDRKLAFT